MQKHWRKFVYLSIFLIFGIIPLSLFGLSILVGLAFNLLKLAFY